MTSTDLHRFGSVVAQASVDWIVSDELVPYERAVTAMEARVAAIRAGDAAEAIWLLEHPALYTSGTSAKPNDLLEPNKFPVFETGRGGEYTYHGPGQQVVYVMLDLTRRGRDVRGFVQALEAWTIDCLREFHVSGELHDGRVGVWVPRPKLAAPVGASTREDKIAAVGVRLRHWVSFHGLSLNVDPDLSHFEGIVPCGISDQGVTSLIDLGLPVTMADVQLALRETFEARFGKTRCAKDAEILAPSRQIP